MSARTLSRVFGAAATLCASGFVLKDSIYDVPAGHRAVIFDRRKGVLPESESAGRHFKIPFIQYPIILDIRCNVHEITSITDTKDDKAAEVSLRVLYHPNAEKISQIFTQYGAAYAENIPGLANEAVVSVFEQYDAHEVFSSRHEIAQRISVDLSNRAEKFGLLIDDVGMTHLYLEEE